MRSKRVAALEAKQPKRNVPKIPIAELRDVLYYLPDDEYPYNKEELLAKTDNLVLVKYDGSFYVAFQISPIVIEALEEFEREY